jgi:hypothetical protein
MCHLISKVQIRSKHFSLCQTKERSSISFSRTKSFRKIYAFDSNKPGEPEPSKLLKQCCLMISKSIPGKCGSKNTVGFLVASLFDYLMNVTSILETFQTSSCKLMMASWILSKLSDPSAR